MLTLFFCLLKNLYRATYAFEKLLEFGSQSG
ncbi:hypothetical protein HKBW3S42_01014 [Candidatus Hakubella thermalkaliphila]|uniref:Uncharacterized protein n=1 Tax=Candidatus Hakubella thermalkaliphila TaxID=2754717 RepID=A0A6V8PKB7_9ACTN|nr:hypothetical protein HKBW3S42_01014 [Candidatus Hakubella thermalkaliphila]